jgi:hypothetical protein
MALAGDGTALRLCLDRIGIGLARSLGIGDGGVEVGDDLRVGHLREDFGNQFRNLRVLGRIALAHVKLGDDCEITRLGEAPAGTAPVSDKATICSR